MKIDTIGGNIRKFRLAKKFRQEDLAEKTVEKMLTQCNKNKVEYRIFGNSDDLSHITGNLYIIFYNVVLY